MNNRTLPMPNQEFDGSIVIASCWGNDTPEDGATWYTLLLLNPSHENGYYRVVEVESETRHIYSETYHPNIIPAAEDYSDSIGGY